MRWVASFSLLATLESAGAAAEDSPLELGRAACERADFRAALAALDELGSQTEAR